MSTTMPSVEDPRRRPARAGEPVWDLASLYPNQGDWTGAVYREHGTFRTGQVASSVLLPGFQVKVAEVLAAGARGVN